MNLSEAFEGENSSLRKAFDACVENNTTVKYESMDGGGYVPSRGAGANIQSGYTPHHEGGWDKEIYQLLANTFQNGNCLDYVDWMDANDVVIDGTYNLEELAIGIQTLLSNQKEQMKRVVGGIPDKGGWGSGVTAEELQYNYGYNKCKQDIITKLNEV